METSQTTIKHWRTFGVEEWGHVKEGAIGLVLGSLLPVLLFYIGYRTWGFSVAGVIVLSWSAAVLAWHYRVRRRLLATLPSELYLIADTVAGWPINVSLVAFTTWYPLRQLRRAGLVSVAPTALSVADAVELAVEETAPSTV